MPRLNDVVVHVTDSEGKALQEWGVQHLRNQNKMSAYIQSESDKQFRISIQPTIPFIAKDAPAAHDYPTRSRDMNRPGFFKMEDQWEDIDENSEAPGARGDFYRPGGQRQGDFRRPGQSSSRGSRSVSNYSPPDRAIKEEPDENDLHSLFSSTQKATKREPDKDHQVFSSPIRRAIRRTPPPPFHLLASLFLDGRTKPERKVVVYLDPNDEDFNDPLGEVHIKTRWVQATDGNLKEHAWVFKDVGIETMFDKMLIAGDVDISKIDKEAEAAIVDAMNSTSLDGEGDVVREERSKVGQIIVKIERVKLGVKWSDRHFRAKHREGEGEDVDMDGAGREITHTTGFKHAKTVSPKPIRVVAYTPYKEGEDPLATFQFFYRSQEQLERFNFAGFKHTTPNRKNSRKPGYSDTTPLSISTPLKLVSKSAKQKGDKNVAFEGQVNQKLARILTPEYDFSDGYRSSDKATKKSESVSPTKERAWICSQSSFANPRTTGSEPRANGRYNLRNVGSTPSGSCSSVKQSTLLPEPLAQSKASTNSFHGFNTPQPPGSDELDNTTSSPEHSRAPTPHHTSTTKDKAKDKNSITDAQYRIPNTASDADDERDPSDLETHPGTDLEEDGCDDNDELPSQDKDDQGLHKEVLKLVIGKRSRAEEDTGADKEEDEEVAATGDGVANSIDDQEIGGLVRESIDGGETSIRLARRNALCGEDVEMVRAMATKRVKIVGEAGSLSGGL